MTSNYHKKVNSDNSSNVANHIHVSDTARLPSTWNSHLNGHLLFASRHNNLARTVNKRSALQKWKMIFEKVKHNTHSHSSKTINDGSHSYSASKGVVPPHDTGLAWTLRQLAGWDAISNMKVWSTKCIGCGKGGGTTMENSWRQHWKMADVEIMEVMECMMYYLRLGWLMKEQPLQISYHYF